MSNYIKLEDAINLYKKWQPTLAINVYEFGKALEVLPSADVVDRKAHEMSIDVLKSEIQDLCKCLERKRGEWKPFDRTWDREIWACSACDESVANMPTIGDKPLYDYCPNCGAKMKG